MVPLSRDGDDDLYDEVSEFTLPLLDDGVVNVVVNVSYIFIALDVFHNIQNHVSNMMVLVNSALMMMAAMTPNRTSIDNVVWVAIVL